MEAFCPTPACWGFICERRIDADHIGQVTIVCHKCKRSWTVQLELIPAEETTHAALQARRLDRPKG
jgi:hypothetical protein